MVITRFISGIIWLSTIALAQPNAAQQSYPKSDPFSGQIVGGEEVRDLNSAEYKHTVRLLITGQLADQGGKTAWRCSGTIIGQDAILTAAHCLPERILGKDGQWIDVEIKKIEAFFKRSPREDRPFGTLHRTYVRHSGFRDNWHVTEADPWQPAQPVNDLAIVFLSREIPADKAPIPWISPETQFSSDSLVSLAGYGRSGTDNPFELPILRRVSVPYLRDLDTSLDYFVGRGDPDRPGTIPTPAGGCFGDSGGPAYFDQEGNMVVAGVIVRGPDAPHGGCEAGLTIVTDLRAYNTWIDSQMERLGTP